MCRRKALKSLSRCPVCHTPVDIEYDRDWKVIKPSNLLCSDICPSLLRQVQMEAGTDGSYGVEALERAWVGGIN